jgi:hypothetical protein
MSSLTYSFRQHLLVMALDKMKITNPIDLYRVAEKRFDVRRVMTKSPTDPGLIDALDVFHSLPIFTAVYALHFGE